MPSHSRCQFSADCARARTPSPSHRPAIGPGPVAGCPLPLTVADLAFDHGDILYHQGDPVRGGYVLRAGMVAVERIDADGRRVVLRVLHAGALFSCSDLFGDGLHGSSARAVSEVVACFLPGERLIASMQADPRLALTMIRAGCEEARLSEDFIFAISREDLTERVLAALELLADRAGTETFELPFTWGDLAAMVGTGPEVLSRVLRKLVCAGRLSYRRRRVTLHRTAARDAG
ncbi:MAG: Crp/Fnr family transcriptional regulator [Magnetospirillum sp.]|nr:Crp/Fnr family transcriptional regulator [Magnetospirillum sp.]